MVPILTRPIPASMIVEAVRARVCAGHILHAPDGSLTVGTYTDVARPYGCFAVLAHGSRRASAERIGIGDGDGALGSGAARYFVHLVGPGAALTAVQRCAWTWGADLVWPG